MNHHIPLDKAPALPPNINQALPVVLDALASCKRTDELALMLPLLVRSNAPAYRRRLAELLGVALDDAPRQGAQVVSLMARRPAPHEGRS